MTDSSLSVGRAGTGQVYKTNTGQEDPAVGRYQTRFTLKLEDVFFWTLLQKGMINKSSAPILSKIPYEGKKASILFLLLLAKPGSCFCTVDKPLTQKPAYTVHWRLCNLRNEKVPSTDINPTDQFPLHYCSVPPTPMCITNYGKNLTVIGEVRLK